MQIGPDIFNKRASESYSKLTDEEKKKFYEESTESDLEVMSHRDILRRREQIFKKIQKLVKAIQHLNNF